MKFNLFKRKYFHLLIFLLVFTSTFILRAHNYERTPTSNHLDEMLYAWSGLYLLETGTPVSWSTLDYPKRAEVFKGKIDYKGSPPETSVTLYRPWLDQPPLFSLIVGYFAHFYNADRTDFIPSSYIRLPVVLFSAITSIFIFLVARLVSGYWMGILSMIVYGTVPIMVFASRTALPENLIALLYVVIAYLLLKFLKSAQFRFILPLPFLVGIAGLSKPTGFFLIFICLLIVFKKIFDIKGFKNALLNCVYIVVFTLPFIIAFVLYGLYYDAEIFRIITTIQSFRPVGFKSLAFFFVSPAYRTEVLVDSWYVFSLLSAVYFIFSPKEGLKRMISIFFIFWVAVVMLTGGEGDMLPWYRFPVFPFLAILGAWGIKLLVEKANLFTSFLSAGMMLGGRSLLVNAFRPNVEPLEYRVIFGVLMLP
ncbi:MAG: glycosyltransferase family 39 protein, partial [Candidatus Daviesbacteria bacterium]|nr:glycosyltransferase family 39 protein [Candidatus Daviesbacteria bacterium]